jgi:uncharacterized protein YuzE
MKRAVPRTTYDAEADAAYIHLTGEIAPGQVRHTVELVEGCVMADVSENGDLLGIEILFAKKGIKVRLPKDIQPVLHAAE